jgi:mannan endo-1,4-beta-mannosidase
MRIYRRVGVVAGFAWLLLLLVPIGVAQVAPAAAGPAPVNPHASPEARALLEYLDSISGRYTITGQHNFPNESSRWTDRTYDVTGKYPGLFGADFGFSAGDDKDSIEGRPAMIAEVERQYRNGAVIALTWHAVRPTDDEPVGFRDSVQGHLTDFEWKELLTPGTDLYRRWCAQVDVIAGYLAQLRDAHVAVLFRPYHEMNGNWFWWGGRPGKNGSAALYRQLYDRFVNYHKLDNLVWVWNVNSPSGNAGTFADYFPGAEYVDLPSVDNYGEFKQNYYNDVLALAGEKPIALAEVGGVPSLDVLKAQPKWTYFMIWAGLAEILNPTEKLREVFDSPDMLNRGDPRLGEAMDAMRKGSGGGDCGTGDCFCVDRGKGAAGEALQRFEAERAQRAGKWRAGDCGIERARDAGDGEISGDLWGGIRDHERRWDRGWHGARSDYRRGETAI